jgi:hypothetical protein
VSPTLPANQGMITSFTSAAMQESCHVVKDDEEKVVEHVTEEEGAEGKEVDDEDAELAIVTVSKNTVGTQTKLRSRDL